jgi:hypothetical protein
LGSDIKRLRATQTNNPYTALACSGGNGTDRIIESSTHDATFTRTILKKSASVLREDEHAERGRQDTQTLIIPMTES